MRRRQLPSDSTEYSVVKIPGISRNVSLTFVNHQITPDAAKRWARSVAGQYWGKTQSYRRVQCDAPCIIYWIECAADSGYVCIIDSISSSPKNKWILGYAVAQVAVQKKMYHACIFPASNGAWAILEDAFPSISQWAAKKECPPQAPPAMKSEYLRQRKRRVHIARTGQIRIGFLIKPQKTSHIK